MVQDFGPERRSWVRREVDFTVGLIFPTRGIREVNMAIFQLQTLSEGGASLYVGTTRSVPEFFYMQFGDEHSELVGCYLVARDDDIMRCHFSPIMTTDKVNEIIARKNKTSLLDSLFDPPQDELVIDLESLF